ncbi:hypothetical protein ACLMJK_000310 [Lecanora helva]
MNEYERRLQNFTKESCAKETKTIPKSMVDSATNTPSPAPISASLPQIRSPANALSFATVDVFTTSSFKGNQLAVVELPAGFDPTPEMKHTIAREFNFSETVFVYPTAPDTFEDSRRLSIFTLNGELPFAGHPVIGAACHICQNVEVGANKIYLRCLAGLIQVQYNQDERIAEIQVPHEVRIHRQPVSARAVLKSQSYLSRTSIITSELPVASIVKGMSFVLVNLPSTVSHLEKLEGGPLGVDVSSVHLDEKWPSTFIGCYFYVIESHPSERVVRLRTRMLEASVGEDAATGSAACTLACFLALKDGKQGKTYKYAIEQGVEMGRASEIFVIVTLGLTGVVHKVVL